MRLKSYKGLFGTLFNSLHIYAHPSKFVNCVFFVLCHVTTFLEIKSTSISFFIVLLGTRYRMSL